METSDKFKPIYDVLNSREKALLCVGPLSTNVIDSAIELSLERDFPIVLIASRRQIDSAEFGGGYVNSWSTFEFAQYVRSKGAAQIFLGRDHGGPNQGSEPQTGRGVIDCIEAAGRSFRTDIDAGLDFIHIDPSVPIAGEVLSYEIAFKRLCELYGDINEYARSRGKNVLFEIGTEEQTGTVPDTDRLASFLADIQRFIQQHNLISPLFVVTQTGTKVMELKNIGAFGTQDTEVHSEIVWAVRKASSIAAAGGFFLKEHNADYLSSETLALRPQMGVKAVNAAPEFGTVETRALMHLLKAHAWSDYEKFVEICLASGRWQKWVLKHSSASDEERAIICGHYCYSDPRVIEIKSQLRAQLTRQDIDLDSYLKRNIKTALLRYASAFGY